MCRRVACSSCGKPTWAGCGAHVEQVLGDVPTDDRCSCGDGAAAPARGGGAGTILRNVVVVVGAVLAAWIIFGRGGDTSGAEARSLVERGAVLVDVRTPAEFAAGHIPGAINIPVQELGERLDELPATDEPLVIYCQTGNRSGTAASLLKEAGHTQVHDLGPMSAW